MQLVKEINAKSGEYRAKISADEKELFHVQLEEKQYDERGRPEGWWRSYGTSSITDSKDKAEEIAQEEIRMHVGKDDLPASTGS